MIKKWLQNYFSIVILLASFMGAFHHHNDLVQHNDCKICTIIANTADVNTPQTPVYFSELLLCKDVTLTQLKTLTSKTTQKSYQSRAPPKLS